MCRSRRCFRRARRPAGRRPRDNPSVCSSNLPAVARRVSKTPSATHCRCRADGQRERSSWAMAAFQPSSAESCRRCAIVLKSRLLRRFTSDLSPERPERRKINLAIRRALGQRVDRHEEARRQFERGEPGDQQPDTPQSGHSTRNRCSRAVSTVLVHQSSGKKVSSTPKGRRARGRGTERRHRDPGHRQQDLAAEVAAPD